MPLRFRILPAPAELRAGWVGDGSSVWAGGPSEERAFEIAAESDHLHIGRRPGAEIELPFPSVSVAHARLFRGPSQGDWWVEDLGSTNGTWLDGARLTSGRPRPVRAGQRLRVATVDIVFEGWSAAARGAESTATIARRLISDLFGVVGGEVPTLSVQSGPARQSVMRLDDRNRRYIAGRADGCDVVLPSEHVSREHAAFVRHWDGVVVADLGSRNGIIVNGIAIVGPTKLADGARIEIGPVVLGFNDPEDRYIRRLESLGNDAVDERGGGTPPRTTAPASDRQQQEAPPVAVVASQGTSQTAGGAPAPDPIATPPDNQDTSRRRPHAAKWLPTALVAGLVLAAVAGLVLLLLTTR